MAKLYRAPIYFALGQVRFNVVLAMDRYVSAIQDKLRKSGYTDFERRNILALNIPLNTAATEQQIVQSPNFQPRYFFFNEARTAAYILDQNGIIFHTTDYDTFDPFSRELMQGLALVNEEVGLSNFDRIGVRFLDAVCPSPGEKFSQYLVPTILGLSEQTAQTELLFSASETRSKKGNRTIMSRTTIFNQEVEGAAFPQELQPVAIKLAERFAKVKGLYAVLDTDCWLDEKEKFDLNRVAKRLNLLHDELRQLFLGLITQHALKAWE